MLYKYSYEKFDNGLEVITIPIRGSGVITSNLYIKAGSRNEILGKSGIAHMLEHMSFKSTKNLKAGEFDRIVKSLGGVDNASTGFDYTHYYIKCAKEHLKTTFELFYEILCNLELKEEEFLTERDVVYEERLWRVDNNPMGYLYFRLFNNAFIYHPYHWTPIGFKEDILNWSIDDIKDFYNKFYSPNNAILLVAGDVTPKEVLKRAKMFEKLKPAKIPQVHQKEPPLDGNKEIEIIKESEVDIVALAYHIPNFKHKDQVTLGAFSEILSGSKSSILKDKLIHKKSLVSEIYAYNMELRDYGLFIILAILQPNVDPKKVIKEIKKSLDVKVTKTLLKRVKNQTKFDFISHLEGSMAVSNLYGDYFAKGDITPLFEYYNNLTSLIPSDFEDIKKYFEKGIEIILRKPN